MLFLRTIISAETRERIVHGKTIDSVHMLDIANMQFKGMLSHLAVKELEDRHDDVSRPVRLNLPAGWGANAELELEGHICAL